MVRAENISVKFNGKSILSNISFVLPEGKSMAIVGPSGCGKTALGRLISRVVQPTSGELKIAGEKVCLMVEQQDNFMAASHMRSGYHGQRYENLGLEEVPTVNEYLNQVYNTGNQEVRQSEIITSLQMMDMLPLAGRKLMMLSNGERKRIQLSVALLQNPDILVLDQPFVGLDVSARKKLEKLIIQLHHSGKTIVLICDSEHIPKEIDFVLALGKGHVLQFVERSAFNPQIQKSENHSIAEHFIEEIKPSGENAFEFAVKMSDVNVVLGGNKILQNINWTVKRGERWALTGPNGAGKTTLLSLITADNPQGYVNDLVLFDRKRGTGESIWDIKKRIGYVSPELHLYFLRGKGIFNTIPGLGNPSGFIGSSILCADVISSGFHDLIGISDKPSDFHRKSVEKWFSVLKLEHLAKSWFHEVSLSEQRLLLLARALVKIPSLLILDEPCQGLDPHQTKLFTRMLDSLCLHLGTTLIYVTHYADEIPKSIEYLLELETGRVKSCGEFHIPEE
ncbi:MAG: ATP-binding cassette domain-containing protein [Prolixibacteraceae bacterium]|jgi:molybdate transport system ATP-binding protein